MQKRLSSTRDDGRRQRRPVHRQRVARAACSCATASSTARRTATARASGSRRRARLDVRRVEFFGTWRGLGQRRTRERPEPVARTERRLALHAAATARRRPPRRPDRQVVIAPFPPATPNTDLVGPVTQVAGAGRDADPAGRRGARRARHGRAAARRGGAGRDDDRDPADPPAGVDRDRERGRRRSRARPERRARLPRERGLHVRPARPARIRARRSASSRTAASVLVVVDGRRAGYSVGMTNFELAQTLVRLGAVDRLRARRGRLLDARVRRAAAQPAVRSGRRAARLDVAPAHVLRRLRAAAAVRSSRRTATASTRRSARSPTRSCAPPTVTATLDRAGRHASPSPRTSAREPGHLPGRVPAAPARSDSPAGRAGRGPLAARGHRDRRPRPRSRPRGRPFTVNSTLGFAKLSRRTLVVARARTADDRRRASRYARPRASLATVETASAA